MQGNVYVKYYYKEAAETALKEMEPLWYNGRKVRLEYCPVDDFRDARCRSYCEAKCDRGQNCNFLHLRHVPTSVKRHSVELMYEEYPE